MNGYKICFCGEIWKIILKLSLSPLLICSTGSGRSRERNSALFCLHNHFQYGNYVIHKTVQLFINLNFNPSNLTINNGNDNIWVH